jgi:hypothetical protein
MKVKERSFKIVGIKTLMLFITFVMMAFSLQYTIIDLIKLNDTLTQNFLQNPVSEEEEEEEKGNETKDIQFFQMHDHVNLFVCNEKSNSYFKLVGFCYDNNFIKTLNQPPEFNL